MEASKNRRTLLLNTDYKPKDIIDWKKAVEMLYKETVWVLSEYEDWTVRSPSMAFTVPSVLLLRRHVKWHDRVSFNRTNIYIRDDFTCMYCGKSAHDKALRIRDLTYDHVVPRSRGGPTSWENIATACERCNHKKADRLPKEAGMYLLQRPYEPKRFNGIEYSLAGKKIPEAWKDYLAPEALALVSS